jgi:hypothetical protein
MSLIEVLTIYSYPFHTSGDAYSKKEPFLEYIYLKLFNNFKFTQKIEKMALFFFWHKLCLFSYAYPYTLFETSISFLWGQDVLWVKP